MANESSTIIQKLWNFCNVLRDDGVGYNDYVEQLTYLLFLKMIDEQAQLPPPFGKPSTIPEEHNWQSLRSKSGDDLEIHYRKTLERLAKEKGLLGVIFRKSQNKIQDPAKLERLIALINDETWFSLDVDVKGAIYEGLLQKNAEDIKNRAGQYFTPRPLIKTIVEVMQPKPGERICDPACGTGGFFLVAYDYLKQHYKLDKAQLQFLRYMTFKGYDVADSVVRLCAMNLYLHGLSGDESPILSKDSLSFTDSNNYEMVLTNPPFGKKSSITITGKDDDNKKENGTKESKKKITHQRDGFYTTTSNKQLNFLQLVRTLLDTNGRAAVVVPDNVLFEGGAGETIRRGLLRDCDVHTLLRLPTGIFYAQGVKANVLFFDRKPASPHPWTKELWIYDFRTNQHCTLKENPLTFEVLKDFIECYNPGDHLKRQETERFKVFTYDELIQRDKASLDIFWLKDESLEDSENLPTPDVLALEIAEDLEAALQLFQGISDNLEPEIIEAIAAD